MVWLVYNILIYPSIRLYNILNYAVTQNHHFFKLYVMYIVYIIILYMYDSCQFSYSKPETAHFVFNTNFLYQCVLHNSTPTPRSNSAPHKHVFNNYVNYCYVCVDIGSRYVTTKWFESYFISHAKQNKKKYIICICFEGTS